MADEVRVVVSGEDGARSWFAWAQFGADLAQELVPFLHEAQRKLREEREET